MKFFNYAICALSFLALASCKDDKKIEPNPDPVTTESSVTMQFGNYVGDKPLVLNSTDFYKNELGNDFKVSLYKYYVSNIVLTGDNGASYTEAESYHLINQEESSSFSFKLEDVPPGNYTSMKLMIGVDSLRNVSGAQTGALDPANGMFWTWNSGYIMAKIEGSSPQATGNTLSFHIGGFMGSTKGIRTVEIPFPQAMVVTKESANKITVKSDLAAWFKAPNLIDFSNLSMINTSNSNSVMMADNYSHMFTVTQVQ